MGLSQSRADKNKASAKRAVTLVLLAGMGAAAVALSGWVAQVGTPEYEQKPASAPESVELGGLPVQGQQVMAQIRSGGPFRYEKDGTVFGNRERLLPNRARGYYREYTVPTPGVNHRGAKRIVCGGQRQALPDACFYSEDHYGSFRLIRQ